MPDHLDKAAKADRLARLNSLVASYVREKNDAYLGRTVQVLADSISRRKDGEISGRTRSAKTVSFEGSADEIGQMIDVRIDQVMVHTLRGTRV